jgi:hypothetical protein
MPPKSKGGSPKASLVHLKLVDRAGRVQELDASLPEILQAVRESGGAGVFELQNGKAAPVLVIVQKVEKNGDQITEMIVREVQPEDFIRVEVELALKSLPDAVRSKNATAVRLQKRVKVRSRVRDLPKKIMVDLSDLSVSETLTAGDIDLPKGVELVTPSDAKLFTLREAKG